MLDDSEGADKAISSCYVLDSERKGQIAWRLGGPRGTPHDRHVLRVGVASTEIDRYIYPSAVSQVERNVLEPGPTAVPLEHLTDKLSFLRKHKDLVPEPRPDSRGRHPLDRQIVAVLLPRNVTREVNYLGLVLHPLFQDQLTAFEIVESVLASHRQTLVRRSVQYPSSCDFTRVGVYVEVLL